MYKTRTNIRLFPFRQAQNLNQQLIEPQDMNQGGGLPDMMVGMNNLGGNGGGGIGLPMNNMGGGLGNMGGVGGGIDVNMMGPGMGNNGGGGGVGNIGGGGGPMNIIGPNPNQNQRKNFNGPNNRNFQQGGGGGGNQMIQVCLFSLLYCTCLFDPSLWWTSCCRHAWRTKSGVWLCRA